MSGFRGPLYGFQIHLIEDQTYRGAGLEDDLLPDKRHFAVLVSDIDEFRNYLIEENVPLTNIIGLGGEVRQFFFLDPSCTPIEANDF